MDHLYVLDRLYMQESMAFSIGALTVDTEAELRHFGNIYTTVAILSGSYPPLERHPRVLAPTDTSVRSAPSHCHRLLLFLPLQAVCALHGPRHEAHPYVSPPPGGRRG